MFGKDEFGECCEDSLPDLFVQSLEDALSSSSPYSELDVVERMEFRERGGEEDCEEDSGGAESCESCESADDNEAGGVASSEGASIGPKPSENGESSEDDDPCGVPRPWDSDESDVVGCNCGCG